MEALKIIKSYEQELTDNNIVIVSYYEVPNYNEVECIDIFYQSQYPQFEVIEVSTTPYPTPPSGSTENI